MIRVLSCLFIAFSSLEDRLQSDGVGSASIPCCSQVESLALTELLESVYPIGVLPEAIFNACQVELGLVWVWPESSPEAWIESAAKQPACCQLVKDVDPGMPCSPWPYLPHTGVPGDIAVLPSAIRQFWDSPPLLTDCWVETIIGQIVSVIRSCAVTSCSSAAGVSQGSCLAVQRGSG